MGLSGSHILQYSRAKIANTNVGNSPQALWEL